MPVDALADFGNNGDEVGLLPALSYIAYHISPGWQRERSREVHRCLRAPLPSPGWPGGRNLLVGGRPIMMGNPGVNVAHASNAGQWSSSHHTGVLLKLPWRAPAALAQALPVRPVGRVPSLQALLPAVRRAPRALARPVRRAPSLQALPALLPVPLAPALPVRRALRSSQCAPQAAASEAVTNNDRIMANTFFMSPSPPDLPSVDFAHIFH